MSAKITKQTFRRRPQHVKAFEITYMMFGPRNEQVVDGVQLFPHGNERIAMVETEHGSRVANVGDWVVEYEDGRLDVVKMEAFNKIFERVEEE